MQRRVAPFVLTQLASLTSITSGSMVFIAIPWIALEISGSAASAGLVVALTAIPGLIVIPVIGSVIDKFGRRRVAIWGEWITATLTLLLPLVANLWGLSLIGLIILATLKNVVSPSGSTARKSLVPDVAKPAGMTLDRANSIHEAVFATGFALGPALATFCIALIGSANTFFVVAFFGALSGLFAILIRVTEQHEENDQTEKEPFIRYAMQGFKILFATPSVLVMMSAIVILAVVYLPTEMVVLPAYYNSLADPEGLGLLISAMAAASILGALFFEQIHKYLSYSTILRIGILGVPLAMLPMSQLPPQWAMLTGALVLGLAWGPLLPLLNTVIQKKIPANKRGRVFALEMTIWNAGPLISMVAVGTAVDGIGIRPTYTILATTVMIAGVIVSFNRHIKKLDG
ncbi:MAG: MFS transporter [Micrococcales bacterium]|nr:MFS transporter [Micrococcales bacterium]MDG1817092.1 MFS transporter [Aquiluna sp.]MBT5397860.1 MFS transporter [Micrococcales bacterium]MBT5431335.1 MFS transporter [Micrococcales bacterium]MBT7926412.1 MFS transporter [Micrococcales bacterium]